jgi:hypothetical protein
MTKEMQGTQNELPSKKIESFLSYLNTDPPKPEIKVNTMAGNSRYLPISFIQMKLDEMFFGLWNWEFQGFQVIANEIVGHGKLSVYHPQAKIWLHRSGTGAVMIQQVSKKRGGSGDITNIGDKIRNTLVKDFPHLEAECLKSAAKKLGKAFGRDLNRAFADEYNSFIEEVTVTEESKAAAEEMLKNCESVSDMKLLLETHPEWINNIHVMKVFTNRRKELQNGNA